MEHERALTRSQLTTPRAAAIAGILFSLLLIASLVLVRLAVPQDPQDAGTSAGRTPNGVISCSKLAPAA